MIGGETGASVMRRYLEAAAKYMDASLVIIPSLPDCIDVQRLAAMIDGCLLTGSPSNIAAQRYGAPDAAAEGPFDEERDEVVFRIISEMTKLGKPILGICRGLQEINVALGGTLRRDLGVSERAIRHHAPADAALDEMFSHSHEVDLAPDGILSSSLRKTSIVVNSVHYQGIDRLARGLSIEATAPDGIVEAVSGQFGPSSILAVQWHPEWKTERNSESQALFRLFSEILRGTPLPERGSAFTPQEFNHV
jgi:Predicted glutamine amidotransferases